MAYSTAPSMEQLTLPPAQFLASLSSYCSSVVSGVLVFHPTAEPDQLLLIQRAAHDTYPNNWEVPGGAVDDSDASFLDAAARELQEETGLEVKGWLGPVGLGDGVKDGECEVAKRGGYRFTSGKGKEIVKFSVEARIESTEVKLDPNEHQDWLWVTREELERCEVNGKKLVFPSDGQRKIMLEGFRLREERRKTA